MSKRTPPAENSSQRRHPLRLGCLTLVGVLFLVLVGTVFAPDRAREQASPLPSATLQPSLTDADLPTHTRTIPPLLTEEAAPATLAATATVFPSATRKPATRPPTSTPAPPTASPTLTPTRTPTAALVLATNTPPALIIVTNTPASPGG